MNSMSRSEIECLIDSWILNQRNREIVRRRFIDGIKIEPLAEEFDLSVSQTKRIISQGKEVILSHCW